MDTLAQLSLALSGALLALIPLVARWAAKAAVERAVEKKFREWEVRFSTFHGRLVEAMEVIRRALARAIEAVEKYRTGSTMRREEDLREELRDVQLRLEEAKLEFEARSFYFDQGTREVVQSLFDGLYKTIGRVRAYLRAEARGSVEHVEKHWGMVEKYAEDLRAAKATLDQRFRVLAGGASEDES